jgi:hypothetical protein
MDAEHRKAALTGFLLVTVIPPLVAFVLGLWLHRWLY